LGERLRQAGQPQQAIGIFQEILAGLGETVSYNRCQTLVRLGRSWRAIGQSVQAATLYRQALAELAQLEPSDEVKQQIGSTQADLADLLMDMGEYGVARQAYEVSLAIDKELDDECGAAVVNGQLGTLAMLEGNLAEAEMRYQSALIIFRTLDEPAQAAIVWHQLGMVYQDAKAWDQAEQAYRASAQLKEAQGNIGGNNGAAMTWNQLAIVCEYSGKPKEAEAWYRKALKVDREIGNMKEVAIDLNNLANLLLTQGNLPEARNLAEESLTLKQTLDPSAAGIWLTYGILAQIATQQDEAAKAQDYRRQSRQSYATFAGLRHALQQWEEEIQGVVDAVVDTEVRQQLEEVLSKMVAGGYGDLVKAVQRILAGVRDEDELCDELDFEDGAIVLEILGRLSA
jgi:tetratricopeptide (TPR) repeat protein